MTRPVRGASCGYSAATTSTCLHRPRCSVTARNVWTNCDYRGPIVVPCTTSEINPSASRQAHLIVINIYHQGIPKEMKRPRRIWKHRSQHPPLCLRAKLRSPSRRFPTNHRILFEANPKCSTTSPHSPKPGQLMPTYRNFIH
jgi:hypothetical protein